MVIFKDFSGPLSVIQVLFNANLIFKDFSRKSCIFMYFKARANPVQISTKISCAGLFSITCIMSSLGSKISWVRLNNV